MNIQQQRKYGKEAFYMDNQTYNSIVNFIWGIADDCLRDVYVRGKYRDVILPMTVIRRLDAVLEETKPAVLEMKKKLDEAGITNQTAALCNTAGQSFCNSSPFCLRDLTSRAKKQTLKADFIAYLDGFSPNVQEILDKFKFRNQIDTMIDADILGAVIEKFVSPTINLSPNPVILRIGFTLAVRLQHGNDTISRASMPERIGFSGSCLGRFPALKVTGPFLN
jgi:type I restriction enzyme M protein